MTQVLLTTEVSFPRLESVRVLCTKPVMCVTLWLGGLGVRHVTGLPGGEWEGIGSEWRRGWRTPWVRRDRTGMWKRETGSGRTEVQFETSKVTEETVGRGRIRGFPKKSTNYAHSCGLGLRGTSVDLGWKNRHHYFNSTLSNGLEDTAVGVRVWERTGVLRWD